VLSNSKCALAHKLGGKSAAAPILYARIALSLLSTQDSALSTKEI